MLSCGGSGISGPTEKCHFIWGGGFYWVESSQTMSEKRVAAAAIPDNSGNLFITGGLSVTTVLASTEFFSGMSAAVSG